MNVCRVAVSVSAQTTAKMMAHPIAQPMLYAVYVFRRHRIMRTYRNVAVLQSRARCWAVSVAARGANSSLRRSLDVFP